MATTKQRVETHVSKGGKSCWSGSRASVRLASLRLRHHFSSWRFFSSLTWAKMGESEICVQLVRKCKLACMHACTHACTHARMHTHTHIKSKTVLEQSLTWAKMGESENWVQLVRKCMFACAYTHTHTPTLHTLHTHTESKIEKSKSGEHKWDKILTHLSVATPALQK